LTGIDSFLSETQIITPKRKKKRTVQPADAFEDTFEDIRFENTLKPGFEIVKK
jgi:hypothetical protein